MHAVVTGSSGFVGHALLARLPRARTLALASDDWRAELDRVDFAGAVVLHLAARVHATSASPDHWNRDNVEKTEALARAAARGGASRFVFMSTIKVHGDETSGAPFRPGDRLRPADGYARSKALAEERLGDISRETGLPLTIVRAPLVFGAAAKANLHDALRLARSALPLPLAGIHNRRSWIHVEDLCGLLVACATDASASRGTFIAAHPDPFSTPRLFGGLRSRLGREPRLFSMPPSFLEVSAALVGKGQAMRRLTRSLEADPREAMDRFGWKPAADFERALDDLVQGAAQ
jgi:nucleoside-diphosphate-sugar epimerase